MNLLFDASIHLGQFCLDDEVQRIACKNSQAQIATKGRQGIVGVCTFNENSWVDHIIWDLQREEQDVFYPFMDVFHSVKDIQRIPLDVRDIDTTKAFVETLHLNPSHAQMCAVAVRLQVPVIHTLYAQLLDPVVVEHMHTEHGILMQKPSAGTETVFPEPKLEDAYQDAFRLLRTRNIDLLQTLLTSQHE